MELTHGAGGIATAVEGGVGVLPLAPGVHAGNAPLRHREEAHQSPDAAEDSAGRSHFQSQSREISEREKEEDLPVGNEVSEANGKSGRSQEGRGTIYWARAQ